MKSRSNASWTVVSLLVECFLFVASGGFVTRAFAQLAPTGEHYAGRPSDTGYGGTFVNATGTFAAAVPLQLPAARGGLPVPLQITYGSHGLGAAGAGWDIPLSYVQHDRTFAHRRPGSAPGALPDPRERVYLSLLGQSVELVPDAGNWIARNGTLEVTARESGASWIAYDGQGRTYTFLRPAVFGGTGLWLLKSITNNDGAILELTYQITTWPLDGGSGLAVDLIRIDYNTLPAAYNIRPVEGCAKNEIVLTYGPGSIAPLSIGVLGDKILVRKRTLALIDVESRSTCLAPFQRLRRYDFQYQPDSDTQLPRLRSVRMYGRQGTAEENVALPVANYDYGSATHGGALRYTHTQTIDLPPGISYDQISGTALDSSVNAPIAGDRYAMWQSLTDMTGDSRPDLVFKKNNKLWVAYNRPAPGGTTTLGSGPQAIAQLSDATFANGALATHTTARRRFEYGPANRNTTNVWRQSIDVNGDGRLDIVDATEQPGHWVVYLNTPGPNGVKWARRSFSIENVRAALVSSGHSLQGDYVPLSRRATGTDVKAWECWRWDGTKWNWYAQGFANHRCQGNAQEILDRGPERTFTEWELADLNGDGYPDFVFNSSPVDFQVHTPPTHPTPVTGEVYPTDFGIGNPFWHPFAPRSTNGVRASFNVVGVRFDTDHDPFSRSVDLLVTNAESGVEEWRCTAAGGPCDDSFQQEFAGFADVNGDGLVDRVVSTKAYLGAFAGTAVEFSRVYMTLPGPLATEHNSHKAECSAGGNLKPTSDQTAGLRDLTGDGIPDYIGNGGLWIGTAAGFRQPIGIVVNGATFRFSHQTESCNGDKSNTDGGLYDIDGDGRPDIIGLNGQTILVSELTGGQAPGNPEAGRLTTIDNGYGAATSVTYASAKQFTDNPVPFPEIVVSSVVTRGTMNLGATLAETRYAYSDAAMIFDSAIDRFAFPGYGRTVELHLVSNAGPAGGSFVADKGTGAATITDAWALTAFNNALTKQERWLRNQRVGRLRDVLALRGVATPDPWSLLNVHVYPPDSRVVGAAHYEWDAKLYETPLNASENQLDCIDMVVPLDYALSFANNLGTNGLDMCRAHGFAFGVSQDSWYGSAPPPSDQNLQTRVRTLSVDDFGRPLVTEYDNDLFRGDDDLCAENSFAAPNGTFPRVLNAVASRRLYDCSKNVTFAGESWTYDALPPGSVSNGHVTSHTVDRHVTDNGVLLGSVRAFDAQYDGAGNLTTISTQRGSAIRTVTFDYDSFGLVPVHTKQDGTGVSSINRTTARDPITLQAIRWDVDGRIERGADFDGFERPVRSTVTPAGGTPGVLSSVTYLGFDGSDPNGRRVVLKRFSNPVPPAQVTTAAGIAQTVFLDELGRDRRAEVAMGSDYANGVLVVGARIYDDAGRVVFRADPYPSSQDPATAYGTSYYFTNFGDLRCVIRGRGPQQFTMITDAVNERFPTSFQRTFALHRQIVETADSASLQAGSPQSGVVRRAVTTGIGRVIERSTLNGGSPLERASLGYDRLGQLTSFVRVLDPVGSTGPVQWSSQLDSTGQALRIAEPNTAIRSNTYSDWGELLETHWIDGGTDRRIVRSYDALGRLTSSEERNNGVTDPETVTSYAYDSAVNVSPLVTPTFVLGRLARASSPSTQVTFSYDAFGRANAQVFTDDEGGLYIEKAEHTADGRLASLQFNLPDQNYAQELVKYAYDSAGRLRLIEYTDPAGSEELYNASAVDLFGRVRKATVGGKTVFHATYANDGRRLLREAGADSPLGSRRWIFEQFDPMGRELARREISNGTANGLHTSFAYDALGRLRHSLKSDGTTTLFDWHYAYDPLGNLLQLNNGAASATLSYETNDPDRVCRIGYGAGGLGGTACNTTYDAVGNTIGQPTRTVPRTIGYFDSGAVRGIDQGSAHARFRYDAFGTVHALDVMGTGIADGRRDRRYGGLIERRDQLINGTASTFISRNIPGAGGLVASRRGTKQDWVFQFSELRANRFFTNRDGAFVQDLDYQPFGEATSTGAQTGTSSYTSNQWNGGDSLAAFGLSQLGARIYDPVIGRFLSRDPFMVVRSAASSNPYAFAANDPVNAADPFGLDCVGAIGQECLYLQSLNPLTLAAAAVNTLFGSGGSSAPAPAPPPRVSSGPQTPAGIALQAAALATVGYVPKGFNLDTLAATGAPMSAMLDTIANADSPERDAAIDEYNANLESWSSFSAGFGDAVWFWCPGCGQNFRQSWGINSGEGDRWAYSVGSFTGIVGSFAAPHPTTVAKPATAVEIAEAPAPQIVMGDVKSINSYEKGLKHISEMEGRGIYNTNGNVGMAMYDASNGEVTMQIFGESVDNAPRTIIWQGRVGQITIPQGLTPTQIGNAVEDDIRNLVGEFLGQDFLPKRPNAPGPDLIPR